jgi:hypothetical protein
MRRLQLATKIVTEDGNLVVREIQDITTTSLSTEPLGASPFPQDLPIL